NQNVAMVFNGTGCTDAGGTCAATGAVSFLATSPTYNFNCNATHTYDWDFGDNSPHSNIASPVHTYGAGSYTVTLTVSNGSSSGTTTKQITVSGSTTGGTGNCPTMDPPNNVYIVYFGDSCSIVGGSCNANSAVAFQLGAYGYQSDCGTPAYSWDFGDGGRSTEATPSHKYATNGVYPVKLTFGNGSQTVDMTATVTVVGAAPVVPPKHRATVH
ncbi:MAG: PKD domain-containing protein, partial [Thermoanaerobaculia bacterium]